MVFIVVNIPVILGPVSKLFKLEKILAEQLIITCLLY